MGRTCSVGDCNSRSGYVARTGDEPKFSRFPKNKDRRAKWANLCGRNCKDTGKPWAPKDTTVNVFVCSKHFITGAQVNDPDHPDFLPSLLLPKTTDNSKVRSQQQLQRYESRARREVLKQLHASDTVNCESTAVTTPHPKDDKSLRDILPGEVDVTMAPDAIATPDVSGVSEYRHDVLPAPNNVPGFAATDPFHVSGFTHNEQLTPQGVPGFATADACRIPGFTHDEPLTPRGVPGFALADISKIPGFCDQILSPVVGLQTPLSGNEPAFSTPQTGTANFSFVSTAPRVLMFGTPDAATASSLSGLAVPLQHLSTGPNEEIERLKRQLAKAEEKLDQTEQKLAKTEKKLADVEKERDSLQDRLEYSEAKLNTVRLSVHTIYENDAKSKFYTGLSWEVFFTTFTFLVSYLPPCSLNCKMSYIDQFLYTLVRLRHNDVFEKLADNAGIGRTTLVDYFAKWLDLIFVKLRWYVHWPDRDYIFKVIPPHFRIHFPKLTCIIDCFELFIEAPKNLRSRSQVYSSYKSHTTAKYLIGCNSLGAVTFLSKGFGGKASDIFIVRESGFIDPHKHFPADQVLADRGFTFKQEMASVCGASLILPHFIKGKGQFTAQELDESRLISSVRIHIERVIGLIKNRFAILQQTIPIRLVKSYIDECTGAEFAQLDKIVTACAVLVNLETGIVYNEGNTPLSVP